jgi:hypothetical protein
LAYANQHKLTKFLLLRKKNYFNSNNTTNASAASKNTSKAKQQQPLFGHRLLCKKQAVLTNAGKSN